MRAVVLCALATLSACVGTSLEAGGHDPANPSAPTRAISEPPPTLRPGFDPEGAAATSDAPEHHHHHHHEHAPEGDAGAR